MTRLGMNLIIVRKEKKASYFDIYENSGKNNNGMPKTKFFLGRIG
jgi:hypothetical protein